MARNITFEPPKPKNEIIFEGKRIEDETDDLAICFMHHLPDAIERLSFYYNYWYQVHYTSTYSDRDKIPDILFPNDNLTDALELFCLNTSFMEWIKRMKDKGKEISELFDKKEDLDAFMSFIRRIYDKDPNSPEKIAFRIAKDIAKFLMRF